MWRHHILWHFSILLLYIIIIIILHEIYSRISGKTQIENLCEIKVNWKNADL